MLFVALVHCGTVHGDSCSCTAINGLCSLSSDKAIGVFSNKNGILAFFEGEIEVYGTRSKDECGAGVVGFVKAEPGAP